VQDGGAHDADADHDHIGHDVILPEKGRRDELRNRRRTNRANSPRRAQARELDRGPSATRTTGFTLAASSPSGIYRSGRDLYFPGIALSSGSVPVRRARSPTS
jgi:hypothetical protein